MENMFQICTQQCTGCGACVNICPTGAVRLQEDPYGYMLARIDTERCIRCGACQRACPAVNPVSAYTDDTKVYAAINRDPQIQTSSTSAGVFYSLARKVLARGGAVFGCAWEEDFTARHICVREEGQLKRLQKSKYVQSEIGASYREAENLLREGKIVLFSGTPCQIAGLRAYLKKDYDNLLLADLVCHGVPNRRILAGFVESQEKARGAKITAMDFRHKIPGLKFYITRIAFAGRRREKILLEPWQGTSYGYLFMKSYICRESCYSCPYASCNRVADITLADYWGIQYVHPRVDASNGVGLVLVNSEKGNAWITALREDLELTESTLEAAAKFNSQLRTGPEKPVGRDELLEAWSRDGYEAFENFYRSQNRQTRGPRKKFKLLIHMPRGVHKLYQRVKGIVGKG